MYAEIVQGQIVAYPCDPQQDNLNTSFPVNWPGGIVNSREYVKVFPSDQPQISYTENLIEGLPVSVLGQYYQTWMAVEASEQEILLRTANQDEMMRLDRNQRLYESDWTQLNDSPLSPQLMEQWRVYRQALRDIPSQSGWPWNITWPVPPQ